MLNFEPINTCNIRRAVRIDNCGKSPPWFWMVGEWSGQIHATYPLPVKLIVWEEWCLTLAKSKINRREIFHRDNYTCQYCGRRIADLTIDHIIPRHLGGKHAGTTFVAACPVCNHRKVGEGLQKKRQCTSYIPPKNPKFGSYLCVRSLSSWKCGLGTLYYWLW